MTVTSLLPAKTVNWSGLMRGASPDLSAERAVLMRDASPLSDRIHVCLMRRASGIPHPGDTRGDASRITLPYDQRAVPPRAPALPHRFVFVTDN